MPEPSIGRQVSAIRAFNRLYTRRIGVVDGMASNPFSLAEARVLFELAHRERPTASDIRKELGLDAGYMSRIVRDFERRKLMRREQSKVDERQRFLSLTPKGQRAFALLDERSNRNVMRMIEEVPPTKRQQLLDAVDTIQKLLGGEGDLRPPYLLRSHQPGDMGWLVYRQAVLYSEEYGWDGAYEALAAEIVAQFLKNYDPKWERAWVAERDGERVGVVFVAKGSEEVAKLRLLHVERAARGLGIGKRLVAECIGFARQAGYQKMTLWTQSILHAARHIYKQAGFQIVREEKHHSFGKDLTAETWELQL
ncbi:MAG TPA: helix-turn-helix domain-containing GNAT family N-acetyltransferase [Terriglobales bacterium]|jgi:DNA-binding MarR family transcriptional regulator/GNAT superfamily N-acetyltransferase|nr:helix-turn-helix domain-containing GNAT family N-acetyltransferase [Terriglobales bacterium]